jgi:hypothetical protein
MDNHTARSPVRHDRKYFVSLALHEAVKSRLQVDPDRVLGLGIAGANKMSWRR